MVDVVRREPTAGVGDRDDAGRGGDRHRPRGRRAAHGVLDQVRDDLQDAIVVGGRQAVGGQLEVEGEAGVAGRRVVAAGDLLGYGREIDRLAAHRECALAQAGRLEQVADEPLEPRRLGADHGSGLSGRQRIVVERLCVAADRGQRRLELVADRQQERLLGLLGLRQLRVHVVERVREVTQLRGPAASR